MITQMARASRVPILTVLLLAAGTSLAAQDAPPSPEAVLGYPLGERFTDFAGVREYSRSLAAASPLVDYRPYGQTPQGRELFQLVIARADHLQRLEEILSRNAELTLPETTPLRAREIVAGNPAVVYFSYGVHGNEASSSEAAMWTAWDLARGSPEVAGVLDSVVVVVDPVANPDGRDRYVNWFRSVVGARPNPSPQAREHREPWPTGRFNHYLFDLNRDWAWGSQPETRGRLETWWRWNPQVHVDFHEMNYNSSYFFFPAAPPINPIYPDHVLQWGRRFGEANARAFDARGWVYYTGEAFDLFYPGYGDSWPSLTGAIGMTYEMAGHGAAGLAVERARGDTLTLLQRATQHRVSGQTTLRTVMSGRTRLLDDFAAGQRDVGRAEPDVLLVPAADPGAMLELVDHLQRQGIVVERTDRAFRAPARPYPGFERRTDFPAGTYLVRMRQPRGRLATTLLQPETELRAEYSYDISAWSLPYAYGIEAHQVGNAPPIAWSPAPRRNAAAANPAPEPGLGYLVAPGAASVPGLVRFLEGGGRAFVIGRPSARESRSWPAGTWYIPAARNDTLAARVTHAGLVDFVTPVRTGLSEEGIDLGSDRVTPVVLPRVAVLTGESVTAPSFGAHWFYLEHELGLQFDALLAGDVGVADLGRYDVIVIPEAGEAVLSEPQRDELRGWVERGGRLIAVGGGARIGAVIGGVEIRELPNDTLQTGRGLRTREERERDAWRDEVPGTIFALRMDPAHPLTYGAGAGTDPSLLFVLHSGLRVFEPGENVEVVAHFASEMPRISGVVSETNVERLDQGAWVVSRRLGRGSVVLFAGDPLFRFFWRATHPLYANAILIGPR